MPEQAGVDRIMKKRLHNPNLAKIHRSYTVEEVASLYVVYKGTVRAWNQGGTFNHQ